MEHKNAMSNFCYFNCRQITFFLPKSYIVIKQSAKTRHIAITVTIFFFINPPLIITVYYMLDIKKLMMQTFSIIPKHIHYLKGV